MGNDPAVSIVINMEKTGESSLKVTLNAAWLSVIKSLWHTNVQTTGVKNYNKIHLKKPLRDWGWTSTSPKNSSITFGL